MPVPTLGGGICEDLVLWGELAQSDVVWSGPPRQGLFDFPMYWDYRTVCLDMPPVLSEVMLDPPQV